jgi:bla regulator protein blaR1
MHLMPRVSLLLVVLGVLWESPGRGQEPAFEVASVRENKSPELAMGGGAVRGGRYAITNVPLANLIQNAYRVQPYQLSGAPEWIRTTRYDITAKAEESTTFDEVQLMVRTLLKERFKLASHFETKEGPVYKLVTARNGPKIKPAQDPRGWTRYASGRIETHNMTMPMLAFTLAGPYLERPVTDETGLTGAFEFTLEWTPDRLWSVEDGPPPDPSGPSIFTAVQEQLGLRLEPARGPVEHLVIDHVEKPAEN